jgi:hypothetical protein
VSRSPALFATSTGPNPHPAPSRAPRAMAPSQSCRPANWHRRIYIISDSHRPARRRLASFFGGVGEPSQSAAPVVGLFRGDGALVRACGRSREGGWRYTNTDADADAGCGAPHGGPRDEARARARADEARRRTRAQVGKLAHRRARLRPRPHQQSEQHARWAVPVPVRGRHAACTNLRAEHDAAANDAVTPSASVPASPSELAHPPPSPSAHRSAATILEPHGGRAAQSSAARRQQAARLVATTTQARATARRTAPRPHLLASSPRAAELPPSSPPATVTARRCRRRSASTPSRGAGTLARQRASCRWLRYCKDAPAPACEQARSGASKPPPLVIPQTACYEIIFELCAHL